MEQHVSQRSVIPVAAETFRGIQLDSAGLVALADVRSIAKWTAITGSSSLLDVLFIAPGIHQQQAAVELNRGEYPATGALTTGYVFRIENEATVRFLQSVGMTGQLTTLAVERLSLKTNGDIMTMAQTPGIVSGLLYIAGLVATMAAIVVIILLGDWWALGILAMLIVARLFNVVIIRRRSRLGWVGAQEPGVHGDLLILLSQDRWIRMQGLVDDLKAVTAGQWLRDKTVIEEFLIAFATVLVYLAAALAGNSSTAGNLVLLCLLLVSTGLLELATSLSKGLQMHGRIVKMAGKRTTYGRRLDLVEQLVEESGRDDWAIGLGMISRSYEQGGKRATL